MYGFAALLIKYVVLSRRKMLTLRSLSSLWTHQELSWRLLYTIIAKTSEGMYARNMTRNITMNITCMVRDWCLVTASGRTSGWGLSSLFIQDLLVNICIFWSCSFCSNSELKSKFRFLISFILLLILVFWCPLLNGMCSLPFISSALEFVGFVCCFKWLFNFTAQLISSH